MADPLSIAASIITLLEAGGVISKALKRVIDLKKAPDVLLALNTEVSDLHLLISEVDDHLRVSDITIPESLTRDLGRIRDLLLGLEIFIAYELTTATQASSSLRIDKSAFWRAGKRIQALKDEIRIEKLALKTSMGQLFS